MGGSDGNWENLNRMINVESYSKMKAGLIMLLSVLVLHTYGQEKEQGQLAYMVVKTHAMCNSCKEILEKDLLFEKGIHKVTVDMEHAEILVDFNAKKTSKENVRKAIAAMGVQADDVPASEEGIKKLPACCQHEGCGRPETTLKSTDPPVE